MPAGALALVPQSRFHVLEQLGGNVEEFNGTRQAWTVRLARKEKAAPDR